MLFIGHLRTNFIETCFKTINSINIFKWRPSYTDFNMFLCVYWCFVFLLFFFQLHLHTQAYNTATISKGYRVFCKYICTGCGRFDEYFRCMKLINDFPKWLFVEKWRGDYCFSLHDVCEDVGIAISENGNIWIVISFKILSLISHLFSSIIESNRDGLTHANAVNTCKCSTMNSL